MKARPIAIAGLILAFLYGAWGNVVAATFCPRFSAHSCCAKHSAHSSSFSNSHHAHQQIEAGVSDEGTTTDACATHQEPERDIDESSFDERSDVELSRPLLAGLLEEQSCTHCLSHSQPARGRFSITTDESSRTSDAAVAPVIRLPLGLPSFAKLLPSYDHGPPGQSRPLFVLNSVFRI